MIFFKIAQNVDQSFWSTFESKFVANKFKKLPKLVALILRNKVSVCERGKIMYLRQRERELEREGVGERERVGER